MSPVFFFFIILDEYPPVEQANTGSSNNFFKQLFKHKFLFHLSNRFTENNKKYEFYSSLIDVLSL